MQEEYIPVLLQKIVVDSIPDFDLYLKSRDKYVLYKKGNYKFDSDNLLNLQRNNVNSLYVRVEDVERYRRYRRRVSDKEKESGAVAESEGALSGGGEAEAYLNINENYHVVEKNFLNPGMEVDFPVFRREGNVLYPLNHEEFERRGLWTVKPGIIDSDSELFISKKDIQQFRGLVESCLRDLSRGHTVNGSATVRKAAFLRELTKLVVREILDDCGNGSKMINLKNVVSYSVDFILQNENAFYSLMMIHSHDLYTYTHSVNVGTLCVGLGSAIGLPLYPDLYMLGLGGMLHDIGKRMIDPRILNKPGPLSEDEYDSIQNHVELGVKTLVENHDLPDEVIRMVAEHHERLDGKGYPDGLGKEQISFFGRIVSIVEVFDAMTTDRPYKKRLRTFDVLDFLNRSGDQFDPNLTREFILLLGRQFEQNTRF